MIKGFSCPKGYQHGDSSWYPFEYCLYKCPNQCLELSFLVLLMEKNLSDVHTPKMISATSLTGCLRESYLKSKFDIMPTPKDLWFTTRGTLAHSILEPIKERVVAHDLFKDISPDRFLVEQRFGYSFEIEVNGVVESVTVSGQIDLYDKQLRRLIDYKSIGDNGLPFILDGAKPEHVTQTNIYKFLLETHGFPVDEIVITYFSLMDVVNTGRSNTIRMRGNTVIERNIPAVPVGSNEYIKNFLEKKSTILYRAFTHEEMPPICDEKQRDWKCGTTKDPFKAYCSVKEHCEYWQSLLAEYNKEQGIS